jgi:cyclopropane fatty-acyl-phospholipid synthase-like methyltransferase
MDAWQNPQLVNNFINGVRAALPLAGEQLQVMLHVIQAAQPQGVERFLDVGCGAGALGQLLLGRYPQAQGVFVDYSEPMLEALRAVLDTERHLCLQHDLTQDAWLDSIPASRKPFDVVVSGYAIHHFSHERKQALYQQAYDLLRPGGVFINVEHVASPDEWVEGLFNEAFIDGLYKMEQQKESGLTRQEVAERIYHNSVDDDDICAPVEEQCAWLREIGFQHVDCYMKIYALAVFGGVKGSG